MRKPRAVLLRLGRLFVVLGVAARTPNCAMFGEPGMATFKKKITAHVPTCNVVMLQKVLARELFFMAK